MTSKYFLDKLLEKFHNLQISFEKDDFRKCYTASVSTIDSNFDKRSISQSFYYLNDDSSFIEDLLEALHRLKKEDIAFSLPEILQSNGKE